MINLSRPERGPWDTYITVPFARYWSTLPFTERVDWPQVLGREAIRGQAKIGRAAEMDSPRVMPGRCSSFSCLLKKKKKVRGRVVCGAKYRASWIIATKSMAVRRDYSPSRSKYMLGGRLFSPHDRQTRALRAQERLVQAIDNPSKMFGWSLGPRVVMLVTDLPRIQVFKMMNRKDLQANEMCAKGLEREPWEYGTDVRNIWRYLFRKCNGKVRKMQIQCNTNRELPLHLWTFSCLSLHFDKSEKPLKNEFPSGRYRKSGYYSPLPRQSDRQYQHPLGLSLFLDITPSLNVVLNYRLLKLIGFRVFRIRRKPNDPEPGPRHELNNRK